MNIYASNVGAAKYINQLITKVETYLDNNILIVGDFNMTLSASDRFSKHYITKETRALNDTLDQMDFTDIYRTLHPNATEYTLFSMSILEKVPCALEKKCIQLHLNVKFCIYL